MEHERKPYLFLSHASLDGDLAQALVELLRDGADVMSGQVVCTSLDGRDLDLGSGVADSVREKLTGAAVVVLVITPQYESRPYCLCELGGAWATGARLFPVVAGDVDPAAFEHVLKDVKAGRLRDSVTLDDLRDIAITELGVNPPTSLWTGAREAFLSALPQVVASLPPPDVVPNARFQEARDEVEALAERLSAQREETRSLQRQVDELVALADQDELDRASAIRTVLESRGELEQFEALASLAAKEMGRYSTVVRQAIYGEYAGVGYTVDPDYRDRTDELDVAVRQRLVEADGWAVAPRLSATAMQGVREALDHVVTFVQERDGEFHDWYAQEFSHDLEVESELFWERHLGL